MSSANCAGERVIGATEDHNEATEAAKLSIDVSACQSREAKKKDVAFHFDKDTARQQTAVSIFSGEGTEGSQDVTGSASCMPPAVQHSLPGHLAGVEVQGEARQADATPADIDVRAILGQVDEQSPTDIIQTALYQLLGQAGKEHPVVEERLAFLNVAKKHPDWMLRIMQTAADIITHDESELNMPRQIIPVAAFLTETFSLCLSVQETVRALADFKTLRWESPKKINGRYCLPQSSSSREHTAELMKAINQAAGVMNPESPLLIGLQMQLYASGVRDQLAAAPNTADVALEELGVPNNNLTLEDKMARLNTLHGWRRTEEVTVGVNALSSGGNVTLKVTGNPLFMREVERMGLALLKEEFNNASKARKLDKEKGAEILNTPNFFSSNQDYCGVWVEQAKVMEMYKIMCAGKFHTMVELVQIVEDVKKFPGANWNAISTQAYQVEEGKLRGVHNSTDSGGFMKPHKVSGRRLYEAVKLESPEDERFVTRALRESDILGGCWKTLETGQLPSNNTQMEMGFRTAEMAFAVAGMAIWFPSKIFKVAAILEFNNVTLCDGRNLKLGTINVNARLGGRPGKRSTWGNTPEQVIVVAAKDSKLWKSTVMWG